jgi:hypothetical protein
MFSVIEYGNIVSVPRPRTFGVTPAIFAEQDSEHSYNGHCSGRLIVIALITVCIIMSPECFRALNVVV